ncbi:efflux RND transporter periplasmic adaptor subunit [Dyadobacter psychrotolerans]|uniref:Efflux RND transporter periplasmic adaptor subunit n=1 Tax=Dyadobacter psychrotolerans TaxID=2541721 RepID=A0A4R5DT52_9BACT|nr:efflux RND transporter periplasmic adaptor subunit [Dyadobacter psychrotolerans]TDE17632.1 efflux RND transporter periplasmic adaptor subunit [Dyadobacter psychrotolerans]
MRNLIKYSWLVFGLLSACTSKENKQVQQDDTTPAVNDTGTKITFPKEQSADFFATENIKSSTLMADITAPAKVAATVVRSDEGASGNIVLFDNPELSGNYTQLLQHLTMISQIRNINIKQRKTELARMKDLQEHGAATGKDLLESQTALSMEETNLLNERSAIIEHETKLKAGGFEPVQLRRAPAGTAYIICDIPENEISMVKEGSKCTLQFTAFPNENFKGKIDDVADMIDQTTRMIKLRVSINNANGKLKAGMFGTLAFGLSEGKNMSIDKDALITIQGKNYVFVKTSPTAFERREVNIGDQVGDRIIAYSGLKNGDNVAVKGVMQLKGLSFGY